MNHIALFLLLVTGWSAGIASAEVSPVQIYEAKKGVLLGQTRVAREFPDGTGRTCVTGFQKPGDGVDITIRAS